MKKVLTKNNVSVLFFLGLFLLHYVLAHFLFSLYFGKEIYLSYFFLIALDGIRKILFYFQQKGKLELDFVQLFMLFTTLQFLGCMAFLLFIRMKFEVHAKTVLLQFVVLFFAVLTYQVIAFRKITKKKEEKINS